MTQTIDLHLRIDPNLHARLKSAAEKEGMSFNAYVRKALQESFDFQVRRSLEVIADDLRRTLRDETFAMCQLAGQLKKAGLLL